MAGGQNKVGGLTKAESTAARTAARMGMAPGTGPVPFVLLQAPVLCPFPAEAGSIVTLQKCESSGQLGDQS